MGDVNEVRLGSLSQTAIVAPTPGDVALSGVKSQENHP